MKYDRQGTFEDVSDEYRQFVEKFKPKKTTDDCYTPPLVFEAVKKWACNEYGVDPSSIVRPFWPGGDYMRFDYHDGCFVLDNPPFSMLSKIVRFYMANGVRFFLFGPGLSIFTARESGANYVCVGYSITFENGAKVSTSFVTSEGKWRVRSAPELYNAIREADEETQKAKKKAVRKLCLPMEVVTAARMNWFSVHGEDFRVLHKECRGIDVLDAGLDIFGGGFLLSERAAAERAAAECFILSDREREMQRRIGQ